MKVLFLIIFLNLFGFYECCYCQEKLYPNEFKLSQVTLSDGPFKQARGLNIKTLIATVDNTSKWNQSKFFDVEYAIPEAVLKVKKKYALSSGL